MFLTGGHNILAEDARVARLYNILSEGERLNELQDKFHRDMAKSEEIMGGTK